MHRKSINALMQLAVREAARKSGSDIDKYILANDGMEVDFHVPLKDFKEIAGFPSNDHAFIRNVLSDLQTCSLEYNILSKKGAKKGWVSMTIVNKCAIIGNNIVFRFPSEIRKYILKPPEFACIPINIQNSFGSGHTLALYENTLRYVKLNSTPYITLIELKKLLSVNENSYTDYKYFKKDLICKAIEEINEKSNIHIELDKNVIKEGRKVHKVRFLVRYKHKVNQPALLAALIPVDKNLKALLLDMGLSCAQIDNLFKKYSLERLYERIMFLKREFSNRKDINNPPAYAWSVINDDAFVSFENNVIEGGCTNSTVEKVEISNADGAMLTFEKIVEMADDLFMQDVFYYAQRVFISNGHKANREQLQVAGSDNWQLCRDNPEFQKSVTGNVFFNKELRARLLRS
jgi:plasmid replication initiation protein